MTIEIVLKCDAADCYAETELRDYTDNDVEHAGWGIDHETGYHYCKKCWPMVQKEMAEEQAV